MAARIRKTLTDSWKEKIKISLIVNRLNECATGNVEMTAQQIKAAEILLKKVLPDLKGVNMSADVTVTKVPEGLDAFYGDTESGS